MDGWMVGWLDQLKIRLTQPWPSFAGARAELGNSNIKYVNLLIHGKCQAYTTVILSTKEESLYSSLACLLV